MRLAKMFPFVFCFFFLFGNTLCAQSEQELQEIKDQLLAMRSYEKVYDYLDKPLLPFSLPGLNKDSVRLKDFHGKKVLINFWFTNCQPCLDEIPILHELQKELASEDVVFLALTFEDEVEVNQFLEHNPFNFTHLVGGKAYTKSLGIRFYPKTIIIDENQIVKKIDKRLPSDATPDELNTWKQGILDALKTE